MKHGKKYRKATEQLEAGRMYPFREGLEIMLKVKPASFDETAEVVLNLGVDPRHADQNVRGAVMLPHGTGRDVRVIDVLDPAAARIGEDFPDRPNVAVSLRVTLGTTYLELGELDKARLQLEQALATARQSLPPDDNLLIS